jgi:hypothetical protein
MPTKKPEAAKPGPSPETIVKNEIDSALSAFRTSDFEARLRGRIRAESERSGRSRRPGRRPVLAWAGLILVLVSGVSIGVWIRSRAHRAGAVLAVFEAALARSPLLRPNRADDPAVPAPQAASLGPLEQTIERALRPLYQEPLAATLGQHVSPTFRSISVEELDGKIGELIKGHKLELFFSEYLKKEEDV